MTMDGLTIPRRIGLLEERRDYYRSMGMQEDLHRTEQELNELHRQLTQRETDLVNRFRYSIKQNTAIC